MTDSEPKTRIWVGVALLGIGAVLTAWVGFASAGTGASQATVLAFELFWAVVIALIGAILVASGLARRFARGRKILAELGADSAHPMTSPGLTYLYQREPPPKYEDKR